jgi:hypothetical protein
MTTEYGAEIAIVTQAAFDERDELETELGFTDCGRVLNENLGIFFAHNVSNKNHWGIE